MKFEIRTDLALETRELYRNAQNIQEDIDKVETRYKKYLGKQRVINTNTYTLKL